MMPISSVSPAGLSPTGEKPFLRFYHSASLRTRTLAVMMVIEQTPDPTRYRDALSDMVMELTDSGLEYYFLRALDLAKVSFVVKQSATVGMAAVKRVMGPVVRNVIGHMDRDQLLAVCGHIRQLME
jgi:hypothetical protein